MNILNTVNNFDISLFEIDKTKNLVNLTKIANYFNKRVSKWRELPSTQRFLSAFFDLNPESENLVVVNGGNTGNGTWASSKIALKFAEWISPEFEVFCNSKLDELFKTGKTELTKPKELSRLEILELALETEKENIKLRADLEYKNQIVIERSESVPPETMRITINRVVRNYAKKQKLWHQVVWSKLYEEFKYRYHYDLKARSKKGQSKIQIAENLGQLENLYNLSLKMFEN